MSMQIFNNAFKRRRTLSDKYNSQFVAVSSTDEEYLSQQPDSPYAVTAGSRRGKRWRGLIWIIVVIVLLMTAAVKNPSESDSREMVKNAIVEKVDDFLQDKMNEDAGIISRVAAFIGITFANSAYDYLVDTQVSDYLFFSTFSATLEFQGFERNVASGLILFGKIIPLKSDLKDLAG